MRRRGLLPMLCVLGVLGAAALAFGQGSDRLLPTRIESKVRVEKNKEILFRLRGRDVRASEVLERMVEDANLSILADARAEELLRRTIVTVDLFERPADYVIELLAAAAGVDVVRELEVFRLLGPPAPGTGVVRVWQRQLAEKLYNIALLSQQDAEVSAVALRGLAELHRRSGDFNSAFAAYETLLARFPRSRPAKDAEILLADCYTAVGDPARATQLLRSFLSRPLEQEVRDAALRRLVGLYIQSRSFRDVEDLRDGFLKLEVISPATLRVLGEAAMGMIEQEDPEAAALLLAPLLERAPQERGVLGPVLALALMMQKQPDPEAASRVLLGAPLPLGDNEAGSATALMALAELARHDQRAPEALVFAAAALRSPDGSPTVRLRAHLLLGSLHRELGLTLRARRHYFEAEQLSDEQAAAALALRSAEMAIEEGEPERARLLYQATTDVAFARHRAELGIARALLASGEAPRARQVLAEIARRELPEANKKELLFLGVDCLEALGEYRDARRLLAGDFAVLGKESP